ncbi:hypothetical protein MLD38_031497 [Melastoma candidum]|uniref:Uncharacterized protein n=1 Tax=Melastoma candidum TaxID=119954 RepID=A0ACB9MR46_9MYRT|nr:hypothetical protein MLD38_031497 [Melastoma candidum]
MLPRLSLFGNEEVEVGADSRWIATVGWGRGSLLRRLSQKPRVGDLCPFPQRGRFSDEQENSTHGGLSMEVTSKASTVDGDLNDSTRTLSEKLSAALLNISAKEALVKQHAKVAEEAVSGWEKAETEVSILKKQLEAAVDRNLKLDDRIGQLDSALKECVRQLRLARDEQDQKIHEAITKRDREWELIKPNLESHVDELGDQFQAPKTRPPGTTNPEYHSKLEVIEKENQSLKCRILSVVEELEIRVLERDLSTQAAESASKQYLESMKKIAKLESECRRLRAVSRKNPLGNDFSCLSVSSAYVESYTDSQSDVGERLLALENDANRVSGLKMVEPDPGNFDSRESLISMLEPHDGQKIVGSSGEVDIMDDFLEMERLAALPDAEVGGCTSKPDHVLDQARAPDISLPSELEIMINRTAELEEQLEKKDAEKVELEMSLIQCQKQLEASRRQLEEAEVNLRECKSLLSTAEQYKEMAEADKKTVYVRAEIAESRIQTLQTRLKQKEVRSVELECMLSVAEELREAAEETAKAALAKAGLVESQMETLKDQLSQTQRRLLEHNKLLSEAEEYKRAVAERKRYGDVKLETTESQLQNAGEEIKRLLVKITLLEEELEKENASSAETMDKCRDLEEELRMLKEEADIKSKAELQLRGGNRMEHKINQEEELALAAGRFAECQKTIGSLREKLTSLALVDDFTVEPEENPGPTDEGLLTQDATEEPFQMHSREIFPFKTDVIV